MHGRRSMLLDTTFTPALCEGILERTVHNPKWLTKEIRVHVVRNDVLAD